MSVKIEEAEGEKESKMGLRQASVLRYKEKRQSRLFSKRIRYEVRKLNAEKRPRMKVNPRPESIDRTLVSAFSLSHMIWGIQNDDGIWVWSCRVDL